MTSMGQPARQQQVDRIVEAALAQSRAARDHGPGSPERSRALAVQHAACRAATAPEVQSALAALWQRDPE